MKARIRSRSCSTWGDAEKSITLNLPPRAARRAPPVAREQLSLVLQQPDQLELVDAGQLALEDAGRVPAGKLRRGRQEQLVGHAARPQLGVQVRTALAEQRSDPEL